VGAARYWSGNCLEVPGSGQPGGCALGLCRSGRFGSVFSVHERTGESEYVGTALTLQTSMGFLLTLVTIRLLPVVQTWVGWQWAFCAPGPGPGGRHWGMSMLRRSAAAQRLAGGTDSRH